MDNGKVKKSEPTESMIGDSIVNIPMEELMRRMGIKTLENSLPVAPPLKLNYSQFAQNAFGTIPVNGHARRCAAFYGEWYDRFNVDTDLQPIHLVDIAPDGYNKEIGDEPNGFVVEITDVDILATKRPNIVINYQIDAEKWCLKDYSGTRLLGKDWFFTEDEYHVDGFAESDKPNVIVIPNGNKSAFFDQVSIGELYDILRYAGGGVLSIVNDVEKYTLLDYLDMSSVVITTPSITAMECAEIGIPLLLTRKTSRDQTGRFLENGIGVEFGKETLLFLLTNKKARLAIAESGREKIKNNIDRVIDTVYNEWKVWFDNKS